MAQYIFKRDAQLGTYVTPGAGMATKAVFFKKGDIIEGEWIRNNYQSEPPAFIVTQTKFGAVHIPFGGRAEAIITQYVFATDLPLQTNKKRYRFKKDYLATLTGTGGVAEIPNFKKQYYKGDIITGNEGFDWTTGYIITIGTHEHFKKGISILIPKDVLELELTQPSEPGTTPPPTAKKQSFKSLALPVSLVTGGVLFLAVGLILIFKA